MSDTATANPLLKLSFRIPFDQIRAQHVQPAVTELLRDARQRIDRLAADPEPRTFDNTLMALDAATEPLDEAMAVVRHLESVATYPELREVYNAVQPDVSAFYSGIPLNAGLWQAIRSYAATDEAHALAGTRRRFLTKTIDSFRRHGADLDPEGKARLEAIDIELATVTTKFSQNVLDSTNAFEVLVADEAGLAGLPPSAVGAARASAEQKGLAGWRFTLQAPSYMPVMTYLADAAIRQKMYRAYAIRASQGEHDNRQLLNRILELRRAKAELLGFRNFADLVLHDRMAHTGERAEEFLKDLKRKTEAQFARENRDLLEYRRSGATALGRSLLRRKAAGRALRFRRRGTAPVFPARARGGGAFRDRASPLRHSGERGTRRSGVGPAGALLRGAGSRRRLHRRVLRGLVSAREQARRRVDGCAHHRLPGQRRLERGLQAPPGPDLRQPDAAARGPARAADAPGSDHHLPRVRPPARSEEHTSELQSLR